VTGGRILFSKAAGRTLVTWRVPTVAREPDTRLLWRPAGGRGGGVAGRTRGRAAQRGIFTFHQHFGHCARQAVFNLRVAVVKAVRVVVCAVAT